ncbi:MAG TPA: hypothetical protein VGH74_07760 [Planctomycetaceae bacterium]|jgi:hypothetical protein
MKRFFIALTAVALVSSLSGCAAFCDSNDTGCINKANAVSGAIAAAGVATLGAAAAYAAAQPVYVQPVYVRPVYYCRWPYC